MTLELYTKQWSEPVDDHENDISLLSASVLLI